MYPSVDAALGSGGVYTRAPVCDWVPHRRVNCSIVVVTGASLLQNYHLIPTVNGTTLMRAARHLASFTDTASLDYRSRKTIVTYSPRLNPWTKRPNP